jgi:hypothetical protein
MLHVLRRAELRLLGASVCQVRFVPSVRIVDRASFHVLMVAVAYG